MRVPAPNFTQTPNDLFDHWLPHLKEIELKVLMVIMRKTFGWHKTRDRISISQFEKLTGSYAKNILGALESLISKGVIYKEVVGEPGKQEAYYELIVSEDSNSSYPWQNTSPPPSKIPAPPPSNLPVTKETLKEIIQNKQQQAAAVSQKNSSCVPFSILDDIHIPYDDKIEITKKYPLETVKNAIAWATHPKNPPRVCLAAAIKFACQRGLSGAEHDKKQETNLEKIQKHFKNGEIYNGAECFLSENHIAFQRGMKHQQVEINQYFKMEKLIGLCKNFGIDFKP
jgi:phage replication O-like protein O